jgi:lysozyme
MRVGSSLLVCAAILVWAAPVNLARAQSTNPAASAPPAGTDAAALGLTDLSNEPSRQDLFASIKAADAAENPADAAEGARFFNLYGPFRFPNDVEFDAALHKPRVESLFGIDISHYTQSSFPIEQLSAKGVLFLYMKATQGTGSLDGKFASFWARAGKLPKGSRVHRGAYHFLASGDPSTPAAAWGKSQAATFLKVLKANGGLLPTDMPPVVDLEWDKASANGPDRWQNRKREDIIAMISAFLAEVKQATGRTPMIYTAQSWWRERMGAEAQFAALAAYPLWLADYSKTSRGSEIPRTINRTPWALWQYTESATMAIGFNGSFDANIYKGPTAAFYSSLGVAEFP